MRALDRFSLTGKRALVTGASRGIGKAIALEFAAAGAEVILCARSESELESVAKAIASAGGKAIVMAMDIVDIDNLEIKLKDLPDIHILCSNAGVNVPKPISETTPADFDKVINLNLKATYFINKFTLAHMIKNKVKGSIINMSSQMGHTGAQDRTLYCASKWAVEGLTKALSIEAGAHGIRVNTICPTFVATPMSAPLLEDKQLMVRVLDKIKLKEGRVANVSDIVGAAIYLASDASAMVTGSALMVDGGWTAG